MSYPGGKGGSGTYPAIINQLPPHETYIEPFLGSGAIMGYKKPAAYSIGIDTDAAALEAFKAFHVPPPIELYHADALTWLIGSRAPFRHNTLIYLDPPYLMSTQSIQRDIYIHEFGTHKQHREITDTNTTRGGPKTEALWMNYPEPNALHDYRYLGADYRERERIKRKANRWQRKFISLPDLERKAILSALIGDHNANNVDIAGNTIEPGDTTRFDDGRRQASPNPQLPSLSPQMSFPHVSSGNRSGNPLPPVANTITIDDIAIPDAAAAPPVPALGDPAPSFQNVANTATIYTCISNRPLTIVY